MVVGPLYRQKFRRLSQREIQNAEQERDAPNKERIFVGGGDLGAGVHRMGAGAVLYGHLFQRAATLP
jgi:hypothetical protein